MEMIYPSLEDIDKYICDPDYNVFLEKCNWCEEREQDSRLKKERRNIWIGIASATIVILVCLVLSSIRAQNLILSKYIF